MYQVLVARSIEGWDQIQETLESKISNLHKGISSATYRHHLNKLMKCPN